MYGRLVYTHKAHEKMADRYVGRYRKIKCVEVILSALSASSLMLAVLGDSKAGTIAGAALSTVLLGLLLYFKEAALGECSQRHTEVAAKLWGLRERLLSLLVDMKDGLASDVIRERRDEINSMLEQIYRGAPRTDAKAYTAAQVALKRSEELFFAPEELDHLLPSDLRRGPQSAA